MLDISLRTFAARFPRFHRTRLARCIYSHGHFEGCGRGGGGSERRARLWGLRRAADGRGRPSLPCLSRV